MDIQLNFSGKKFPNKRISKKNFDWNINRLKFHYSNSLDIQRNYIVLKRKDLRNKIRAYLNLSTLDKSMETLIGFAVRDVFKGVVSKTYDTFNDISEKQQQLQRDEQQQQQQLANSFNTKHHLCSLFAIKFRFQEIRSSRSSNECFYDFWFCLWLIH